MGDVFNMEATNRRNMKRKRDGAEKRGGVGEDFAFSNFEFSAETTKRRKMEKEGGRRNEHAATMLSKVQQVQERLASLRVYIFAFLL